MAKPLPPESPTRIQPKRVLVKEAATKTTAANVEKKKRAKKHAPTYRQLVLAGIRKKQSRTKKNGAGLLAVTEYVKEQLSPHVRCVQTKVKRALEAALAAGLVTRNSKLRYMLAGTDSATTTEKRKKTKTTKKQATKKEGKVAVTKKVVEKKKRDVSKTTKKNNKKGNEKAKRNAEASGKKVKAAKEGVAKKKAKKGDDAIGKVNKKTMEETKTTNSFVTPSSQHTKTKYVYC